MNSDQSKDLDHLMLNLDLQALDLDLGLLDDTLVKLRLQQKLL